MRETRTDAEIEQALALRRRVFCDEQGVSVAADQDGRDGEAIHLVALRGRVVVGTCRLLQDDGSVRLGRTAVASGDRRRGIGAALLAAADEASLASGTGCIRLHAQTAARSLYERAGYVVEGPPFLEQGIEHVTMVKRIA